MYSSPTSSVIIV